MVFWIWKKDLIKLLKYTSCRQGFSEDCLKEYENCADNLSNNLGLHEKSILIFFQFYFKIRRNQSEIVVEAAYDLYPCKCFEILKLKFWGRSLETKHFGFYSNSWGADEIKDLPILVDFRAQKHGVVTHG